jgi:proteasome lid subunit RPN8/RPN11
MPLSTSIAFPRSLVNQIFHCAQQQPKRETCGLIGAKDGLPASFYAVDNIAEQPECRFGLDPQQQIGAMRAMRERGEDLFAIFHSHPEAAAEPSSLDLELAAYPEALYLIASLGIQGVLELRGFRLQASGRFAEVPLLLQPST